VLFGSELWRKAVLSNLIKTVKLNDNTFIIMRIDKFEKRKMVRNNCSILTNDDWSGYFKLYSIQNFKFFINKMRYK
jgi:hypothetical protein